MYIIKKYIFYARAIKYNTPTTLAPSPMLPRKSAQRQKKKAAKKRHADQAGPYSAKHARQQEARLAAAAATKPTEQPQPPAQPKGPSKAKGAKKAKR